MRIGQPLREPAFIGSATQRYRQSVMRQVEAGAIVRTPPLTMDAAQDEGVEPFKTAPHAGAGAELLMTDDIYDVALRQQKALETARRAAETAQQAAERASEAMTLLQAAETMSSVPTELELRISEGVQRSDHTSWKWCWSGW